jgi:NAD(P)-dependent dehydrogenase (short-subunit alcohol dehydrogenase family)
LPNPASRSLSGRVVAITGGARGIGRATAGALTRKGARVAIGDLDLALAESTAAAIGGGALALGLDVTDRASFELFLARTEEQLGPLEVLINNAGIMPIGPFSAEAEETARRVLEINTWAVILGCKLALARMLPRGSGHIVNVASQAGKVGFAGGATYCASKHAVVGLTTSLADELDGTGIELSCVMPAVVNTELSSGLPRTRLIKAVEPEDVADAIVVALERPRLNVHVPRIAASFSVMTLLPIGVKHRLERLLGGEQALLNTDPAERAEYEARAGGGLQARIGSPHGSRQSNL